MYSDQVFLLLSAAAVLLEMAAVCWVWERKMKQAAQREQEGVHDDYCTQEAARLYKLRRR